MARRHLGRAWVGGGRAECRLRVDVSGKAVLGINVSSIDGLRMAVGNINSTW